jgi:hypothetical protein
MTSPELENLARIGRLQPFLAIDREVATLLRSGRSRLADARNVQLSLESRFDLAYNAAHALALAALRRAGYRSSNRFVVFQVLPFTAGLPATVWRVLARAHDQRNLFEYEGGGEVDERLLADLIAATEQLDDALGAER